MKRNWKAAALTLLVIMVAIALSLSNKTLNRYTADADGTAAARAAKFAPVWIAKSSSTNNRTWDGLGSLNSGVVIHPGNWTKQYYVYWRFFNDSEVAVTASMVPMVTKGVNSGSGGTSVGHYYPLAVNNAAKPRREFTQATFRGGLNFIIKNSSGTQLWESKFDTGSVWWNWTGAAPSAGNDVLAATPSWQTPRTWAPNGTDYYLFSFKGYDSESPPRRLANDVNTTSTVNGYGSAITQAAPMCFGVGSNTITNLNETFWRTIRVNADGFNTQVD